MVNAPNIAGILLAVFYAVSFTKTPFTKLIKDNDWQTWLIRMWALVLGVVFSVVNNHYGIGHTASTYQAVVDGALAAVSAIITYHVGNGFVGAFDGSSDTKPAVVQTPEDDDTDPYIPPDDAYIPDPTGQKDMTPNPGPVTLTADQHAILQQAGKPVVLPTTVKS